MSIAILLHIKATDATATRARLARTSIAADLADVSVSLVHPPYFLAEIYGFDPTVTLYFALNKDMAMEARAAIADIVRRYVETSDEDLVAVF